MEFILYALSLLICITIHEFSHALVADRLGDPTAKLAGRITLNPLAHLDPIGTVAMLLFHFGWGKPVPFDPYNLKNPKTDSALIAVAGPVSNLLLASAIALVLRFLPLGDGLFPTFLTILLGVNVGLAIFNFIPIHPLDGGKILIGLAPDDVAAGWDQTLHQYGMFILIALLLPLYNGISPLNALLDPIMNFILKFLLGY